MVTLTMPSIPRSGALWLIISLLSGLSSSGRSASGSVLNAVDPYPMLQHQIGFRQTFGGLGVEEGGFAQQTQDGGYILAGVTTSFGGGGWNTWLVKVSGDGSEQWSRTFGTEFSYYEGGESIQETPDGGFVLLAASLSALPSDYDIRLIRTNRNGRQLWTRTYGGNGWDWGRCVRQTQDGGYIITGWTDSKGSGGGDVWLLKTDRRGQEEWDRTYGGFEIDQGNWVEQTDEGGYILTGATSSNSVGLDDLWILRTDAAGDVEWMRTFGGVGSDEGHYIQTTADGGYIVIGSTASAGAGESDVWLLRLSSDGRMLWNRTFGGTQWDWGNAVHETPDGGFICIGTTLSFGTGNSDLWLIKTDPDGQEEWTRTYGGPDLDFGLSIQLTSDGGYIIAGQTSSFGAGNSDLWLIKTDSEGRTTQ